LDCSHTDWIAVDHFDQMEASWLYVQYLFGIQRDDCDYSKVLLQMTDELKAYIKLLVCFPNRTSEKEFEHIIKAASASERVSVLFTCILNSRYVCHLQPSSIGVSSSIFSLM